MSCVEIIACTTEFSSGGALSSSLLSVFFGRVRWRKVLCTDNLCFSVCVCVCLVDFIKLSF